MPSNSRLEPHQAFCASRPSFKPTPVWRIVLTWSLVSHGCCYQAISLTDTSPWGILSAIAMFQQQPYFPGTRLRLNTRSHHERFFSVGVCLFVKSNVAENS